MPDRSARRHGVRPEGDTALRSSETPARRAKKAAIKFHRVTTTHDRRARLDVGPRRDRSTIDTSSFSKATPHPDARPDSTIQCVDSTFVRAARRTGAARPWSDLEAARPRQVRPTCHGSLARRPGAQDRSCAPAVLGRTCPVSQVASHPRRRAAAVSGRPAVRARRNEDLSLRNTVCWPAVVVSRAVSPLENPCIVSPFVSVSPRSPS